LHAKVKLFYVAWYWFATLMEETIKDWENLFVYYFTPFFAVYNIFHTVFVVMYLSHDHSKLVIV